MNIKKVTSVVTTAAGKVAKMKTSHKIALGVATAVTAAATGTVIVKKSQAKKQERSVKSLVIEDAAKMLPLSVKKNIDYEKSLEESAKPFILPEQTKKVLGLIELDEFADTFILEPKNKTTDCVIFYIHGTDFWSNPSKFHYNFFKKLSNKLGAQLILPVYPKAPSNTAVEIQKMLLDRYIYLLEEKEIPADRIVFAGDAAGGGIAVSLLQKIKYQTLPMPKQAFLISPWLDVTLSNPEIDDIQPYDSVLNADNLRDKGEMYAGELDLTHPAVSPIYGDLTDLAKITVFVGTRDIFSADAALLKELADENELDIDVNIYKNQMHFFVGLPIPEAELAFAVMASELYGVEECEECEEEEAALEEEPEELAEAIEEAEVIEEIIEAEAAPEEAAQAEAQTEE